MSTLSMNPEGYHELTTQLSEILRTKKLEQQSNTFWLHTQEKLGEAEDQTPVKTRILRELFDLKEKEKLNPQDDTESGSIFPERFDWTDTLSTENEKRAVGDNLVKYHDVFASHRLDIGMNTEFKMKLTPNDDKAVYNQSLSTPKY